MNRKTNAGEDLFIGLMELASNLSSLGVEAFNMAERYVREDMCIPNCPDPECEACVSRPYFQQASLDTLAILRQCHTALLEHNDTKMKEASDKFYGDHPRFKDGGTPSPIGDVLSELVGALLNRGGARMIELGPDLKPRGDRRLDPAAILAMLMAGGPAPRI